MELTDLEQSKAGVGQGCCLTVWMLYEDSETGLRARRSLNVVGEQALSPECVRTRLWRIDLLKPAWLREQAAQEAAAADIIIISVHGNKGLSRELREWLCRWLECKQERAYALGLLLDACCANGSVPNPVAAYLQTISRAGGADLFQGFCDSSATEPGSFEENRAHNAFGSTLIRAEERVTAGRYAHWGINE